jgi:hypothetical protein
MNKTFTKEEFQEMVAQLESEFHSIMKSEQEESAQRLAKSEDEAKEEDKKEEKEEPKDEAKEESKEESKEEDKKEDESHGYDEEDLEEMHKMYSAMSKAEREAHKAAIEKCGEMSQMAKSEEKSVEVEKEEVEVKTETNSEDTTLLKSEIETIKKENEELKKNIEGLVAAMNVYVAKKAPARKAITEIEFVKKSEEGNSEEKPLSKSEIDKILAKKVVDPSLSRTDREAINSFYLTNAGVEKIKHLLKQ